MDYIISIEWQIGKLNIHLLKVDSSILFTYKIDSIYDKHTIETVLDCAVNNDYKTLVDLFKKRYNLDHSTIRFSWGYSIRCMMKNNHNDNKNYNKGESKKWQKL